eukprot:1154895-Pelagomonas_calceolata.AAC.4
MKALPRGHHPWQQQCQALTQTGRHYLEVLTSLGSSSAGHPGKIPILSSALGPCEPLCAFTCRLARRSGWGHSLLLCGRGSGAAHQVCPAPAHTLSATSTSSTVKTWMLPSPRHVRGVPWPAIVCNCLSTLWLETQCMSCYRKAQKENYPGCTREQKSCSASSWCYTAATSRQQNLKAGGILFLYAEADLPRRAQL